MIQLPFKHVLQANDLTPITIQRINERATQLLQAGFTNSLRGKIVATLFFEPSTRTRLSFSSATLRCGGQVISVDQPASTSCAKGETLEDTIRMVSNYADVIVLRHPEAGSAARAAAVATVPVINAGDGPNAHPSQTLLDLFTIKQALGRLTNFTIGMVGDLQYSRVAHSLATVLAPAEGVQQVWIAPEELVMPKLVRSAVKERGGTVTETKNLQKELPNLDVVLMTRVQQERFANQVDYERLKDVYVLTPELVAKAKPELKIIAPLPRTNELPVTLDSLPQAYYFKQAAFGVPVRAALLEYCLGL